MTYSVEFHASALAQLHGLPPEVFDVLVDRVSTLVRAPWESRVPDPTDPAFRQCTFGSFGLLSFYVDNRQDLVRIFDVTWAG